MIKLKDLSNFISFNDASWIKNLISEYDKISVNCSPDIPYEYLDPINLVIITEPVKTKCGHIFDKCCIYKIVMKFGRCPLCRNKLQISELENLDDFKKEIHDYMDKKLYQ